jgi:predicted transglutaminase-like cysteine proteinase
MEKVASLHSESHALLMISTSKLDAQFAMVTRLRPDKTCAVRVQEKEAMVHLDSVSSLTFTEDRIAQLAMVNATFN